MEDSSTERLLSRAPSNTAKQNRTGSDSHIVNIKIPCIYKVPPMLRELSEKECTPRLVSIGPFHHQNNLLSSMEPVKEDCFEVILRQNTNIKNADIHEIETSTELKLDDIKHYYAEITSHKFPCDDRDFFLMILRDASFIIKLFQMNNIQRPGQSRSSSDYDHEMLSNILNTPWLKRGIERDLILLENQLPYCVLCHLYKKYFKRFFPESFTDLALNFFSIESSLIDKKLPHLKISLCTLETKVLLHMTDLMRMSLIPTINCKTFATVSQYPCSATKLDTAGIEFVLADDENTPLTQVKSLISAFSLYLPCLPSPKPLKFIFPEFEVRDDSDCILRNIMAFEQYRHSDEPYVCSYVMLMHKLIKTREDADLLMEKKIIKHLGGDEDVVKLFDTLSRHIEIPKSYYASDCVRINNHYDKKWNRWMASFRRTYLKDAWTIGSTILGIVLFVFSVTSTIKSIFY